MSPIYDVMNMAIVAVVILLAVAAIVASRRHDGQADRDSDALWDELRKAHGLSRREAQVLRAAAARSALDPKSLIFVEPHLVQRLAETSSSSVKAGDGGCDLERRLFS